ncbi:hypothetical protein COR50_19590 [Chitinophaga caeni]|uniref:Uncharacterized protein n=1 Tax=Chitinophaga caeni TaxID=2029983 RepID=A0A291QZ29_9BACT|nr:hypothetical protein COR50_19590 [Chitinophaga caeni]
MSTCTFLCTFLLAQKSTKKGHKLAITAANLIARSSFCTTVWLSYGSLLTARSSTVLLAGVHRIMNVSSFAYILDQVRNSSTFKAFLVGQQCKFYIERACNRMPYFRNIDNIDRPNS